MIAYTTHRAAKFCQAALAKVGIGVVRNEALINLQRDYWRMKETAAKEGNASRDLQFLLSLPNHQSSSILKYWMASKSEFRQDLFVLSEVNFKREGYFGEFGAANGQSGSNTYLLEKEFAWTGILSEPARVWHLELRRNRNAIVDSRCVWSQSGVIVTFNQAPAATLSTIDAFSSSDGHSLARQEGIRYEVETISLNDLLSKYNAPTRMDYLSLDTEGSELAILQGFDFNKYSFKCITVEHNYTPMREKVYSLLTRNGYIRKYVEVSHVDDWYVKP
jgi:FkbM family methyltransferase